MCVIADYIRRNITAHWRGHYDLLLTAAVTLIGIRVGLGTMQYTALTDTSPGILATWLAFSFTVLVWQIVGGWRTCENHIRSGGGMFTGWVGYAALLITIALAVFQALDGVSSQVKLQPAPTAQSAQLPLRDDNTVIIIDQPLDWPLFSTFKSSLEKHASIKTVALDSTGGRVFTARAIALLIEEYRLDTYVEQTCYSACTIAFMAGLTRTAATGAELGFHQYALQQDYQLQQIDITQELAKDREFFQRQGVSAEFVSTVFQATPDSLWKPDRKTLLDAGVLTD
jgi:ATP-dependent protease ClpP protease subunit